MILSVNDIGKLGSILGVWAHPDDETMSSGGIMATAVKNGQKVICLTATKGEEGSQDERRWPKSQLAKIRQKELQASLKIIGIKYHHWLGFLDGKCDANSKKAVEIVSKYIMKYQPDTILTFGADGFTGHDDHKAVHTWAKKAVTLTKSRANIYHTAITKKHYINGLKTLDEELNIFYNIKEPKFVSEKECEINFGLSPKLSEIKFRALKAMPSQTEIMLKGFSKDIICNSLSVEQFVKAK